MKEGVELHNHEMVVLGIVKGMRKEERVALRGLRSTSNQ